VKAHKEIGQLVFADLLFVFFIHILRYGVIDIKKGGRHLGDTGQQVFTQCAVNINLAGYGYPTSCQTRVNIAGDKAEIRFKRGPAFISKNTVFFSPEIFFHKIE